MTKEEARAYFIDCNERIISVAKDENIYNYKTQQVEDVFMRRTFEANELAIKALQQMPSISEDSTPLTEIFEGIKAEIKNEQNPYLCIKECGGFAGGYYDGLAKTLKIIDRHIGEGSEEECR